MVTRDMHVDVPGMVDTVRERPSMLAAKACESRLRLTGNAMVLAVDTAQSSKAANSPEKMLAHQLATLHRLGMLAAGKARDLLERHGTLNQATSVEAARQMNAAARAFGAYQDGFVAPRSHPPRWQANRSRRSPARRGRPRWTGRCGCWGRQGWGHRTRGRGRK